MKIRKKLKKIKVNKVDDFDLSRIINNYKNLRKDFKKYLKAVLMLITDAFQLNKKRFIIIKLQNKYSKQILKTTIY